MHMGHVLLESKGRHISGKIADIDTSAPCCSAPPAAAAAAGAAGLADVEVVVVGTGEGARDALVLEEAPPPLEVGAAGGLTILGCVEKRRWSAICIRGGNRGGASMASCNLHERTDGVVLHCPHAPAAISSISTDTD